MFGKDNEYKRVSNKEPNINQRTLKLLLIVSIILIGLLVFFGVHYILNNKTFSFKEDNSKNLVYTRYKSTSSDQKIPYLNTNNKDLQLINDDIESFVKKYLNDSNTKIVYEYDNSGIILSLLVGIFDSKNYSVKFRSYNIDLDDEVLLSDKYLLSYYDIQYKDIKENIKNKLTEYYNKEIGEYFETTEVSYDTYLKMRDIDNIDTNEYALYIKEGNLTAFVPINPYSIYGEESFFTNDKFNFYLKKAPAE